MPWRGAWAYLMLRVGLTGGIGAGKSTVARLLVERGATLIDADLIAREVVEPGTPGLAAVVTEFGDTVLAPDGSLDRPALGALVFADDGRRAALNAIVHPMVHQRRQELVAEAGADAIVVEDIPLLVENSLGVNYPLVVVVHAPQHERVRRLVADRGMSGADALARIRAQASDEERRAAADVWIDNSGSLGDTVAAVDQLWRDRLVPFEANLRTSTPAPRPPARIKAPDPAWLAQAARIAARVRRVAGDRALRVEHVGPTSVPGGSAVDVIDLRVVVADLRIAEDVAAGLGDAGLVSVTSDGTAGGSESSGYERLARNADPGRAVDCHICPQAFGGLMPVDAP